MNIKNVLLILNKIDDYRNGGRDRNRRDWDHGFNRRDRPVTTKSGRTIKGRGKFVIIYLSIFFLIFFLFFYFLEI